MKMTFFKFGASLVVALSFFAQSLFAVPAHSEVNTYRQPDGSTVQARLSGDEWFHWTEATTGEVIIRNQAGYFEYASIVNMKGKQTLSPSGIAYSTEGAKAAAQRKGVQQFTPVLKQDLSSIWQEARKKRNFTVPLPRADFPQK